MLFGPIVPVYLLNPFKSQWRFCIKIDFNMPRKLILLIALVVVAMACPPACDMQCNYPLVTYDCVLCLQTYFRKWNIELSGCDCMETYSEMKPGSYWCRPANCSAYSTDGCISCGKHQVLWLNTELNMTMCVCEPTYFPTAMSTC